LNFFEARLIRLVGRIKITLLLKIQLKQHHILYVKIVYKHTDRSTVKEEGHGSLIKEKSTKDAPSLVKNLTDNSEKAEMLLEIKVMLIKLQNESPYFY
jgi:hypothetical protein